VILSADTPSATNPGGCVRVETSGVDTELVIGGNPSPATEVWISDLDRGRYQLDAPSLETEDDPGELSGGRFHVACERIL
jgi:hypothetical protein